MSLTTAIGESQPEEEATSQTKTCSVGIQYCCKHMDVDTDSNPTVVKASDEVTTVPSQLSNGSCSDVEKPAEDFASREEPVQEQQQDGQQETELVAPTESKLPVDNADEEETAENADAVTEEMQEQQPTSGGAEPNDGGDVQLHQEEIQEELDITITETFEATVKESSKEVLAEPAETIKENEGKENKHPEETEERKMPPSTSEGDAVAIDEADSIEEATVETGVSKTAETMDEPQDELLDEDKENKIEVESVEESEKPENEEDSIQIEKPEQGEVKETTESSEAQEALVEAETLETTVTEAAEPKNKPPSETKSKKKMEAKAVSMAASKPTAVASKVKHATSRSTTKTDAEVQKEGVSAIVKPKKTPTMPKRATAIPVSSKKEHDEAPGSSEHKASASLRRTSAGRTIGLKQQQPHPEEAKDTKLTTATPKARPTSARKSPAVSATAASAAEAKDADEKATPTSKQPKRRSLTTEKPAATPSMATKMRAVSAADATAKTTHNTTITTRRATVGDSATASATTNATADTAVTFGHSAPIQAAKADELRRSNSSQLSKTESGGSSEVFPDGGGASSGGTSRLRAPGASRVHRVTQRTPDCTELQHVTKATPMPESRGAVEIKQTAASRGRIQMLHEEANKALEASNENQYLTPLQRKESEVKELRRLLQEAYQAITEREEEIEAAARAKAEDINNAVKDKEEFIAELQAEIDQLTLDYQALTALHGEVKRREEELEREVARLRQEMEEHEQRHQQYYLEMYRKGQESAKFERQDELEKLAVQEPDKVSIDELVEKLELTQQDLHKWQTLKLMETYSESEQPATEADARLRFLRDSMFHYLTEKDRDQGLQHLTAIIGIFNFTEVQMATIMKCLAERKKRGKI